MLRKLLLGFALAAPAACVSSPPPTFGTATFAIDGATTGVTTAWAVPSYAFFDDANDSYGGYAIMFSTSAVAPDTPCSDTQLSAAQQLDLSTPQVFHSSGGPASLQLGDIPVVAEDKVPDDAPPTSTIADFYASAMTSGHVTITAFDPPAIRGTFDASGGGTSFAGSFDVMICPP